MQIIQTILTKNDCYAKHPNRKITPKGLMLHSVGCAVADATVFTSRWNKSGVSACVHGFIDSRSQIIYQTLPWNHYGWHAGGSANATHIGCEMCESTYIKYTHGATFKVINLAKARDDAKRAYDAAVWLYSELCRDYQLNPRTQIISHNEGGKMGVASGHVDPEHYWGQLELDYTMNGFRSDVAQLVSGVEVVEPEDNLPKLVRVSRDDLNIRTGPGTNYPTVGRYTGRGVFTIVDVEPGAGSKAGWGLLKAYSPSRNGWISLDFTQALN